MACLLLNMEPDLSDPRVAIARDRVIAAQILSALPHRIGWMLSDEDDLARPADWAPEIMGRVTLSIPALVRVHNTFAPNTVNRFESRPVAARRTARLLLGKFGIVNKERKIMSEHEHEHEHEHIEHIAPPIADEPEPFTLAPGVRVTLLPDASRGLPEEHGVVLEVADDFISVEVDPLYRVDERDDGHRDVMAAECGPDPVGEMRMKVESETVKAKKAISTEMKAQKAADREAKKADREAAKAAKAADREAKKADREAAKAAKAADREAAKAAKAAERGITISAEMKAQKAADREAKKADREAAKAAKAADREAKKAERATQAPRPKGAKVESADGVIVSYINPTSSRAQFVRAIDGIRTVDQLGSQFDFTGSQVKSRLAALKEFKGIGHKISESGSVSLVFPADKKLEDYFKKVASE